MSIEAAVLEVAKAINALAAAVQGVVANAKPGGVTRVDPSVPKGTPPVERPKAAVTQIKPPVKSKPAAEGDLDYETDVKPLALALAKADRPALLAIYKEFGVNVGSELKPEQLADAKRKIEEASV